MRLCQFAIYNGYVINKTFSDDFVGSRENFDMHILYMHHIRIYHTQKIFPVRHIDLQDSY